MTKLVMDYLITYRITINWQSVALAFNRTLPEGNIYALLDEYDQATHFFYGVKFNNSDIYVDGTGIQSIDEIKSRSIVNF